MHPTLTVSQRLYTVVHSIIQHQLKVAIFNASYLYLQNALLEGHYRLYNLRCATEGIYHLPGHVKNLMMAVQRMSAGRSGGSQGCCRRSLPLVHQGSVLPGHVCEHTAA